MIIPVRCFSCNKEISSKYEEYLSMRESGIIAAEALDKVGMTRICCRRMFLGHVDIGEQLLQFEQVEEGI
ncbi:hypothetical protein NUSPORA_02786 [Nucleospora cyclopteri]